MLVKEGKKISILSDGVRLNGSVYRGILELMGRFGYLSMEEVMYGFDLSEQMIKCQQERAESFGRCIFTFGQADQFLRDLENTIFV